jgi:hypothetical protein
MDWDLDFLEGNELFAVGDDGILGFSGCLIYAQPRSPDACMCSTDLCHNVAMKLGFVGFGVAAFIWSAAAKHATVSASAEKVCPASFALATGACVPLAVGQGLAVCRYPQGVCECIEKPSCSGVPRPPSEPTWTCSRPRTNGCPTKAPMVGNKCALKRKVSCSYGDCESMTFACVTGKWKVTAANGPPPVAQNKGLQTTNWKLCAPSNRFICAPRSQGIAPAQGETVPLVCGCAPQCDGLTLIAHEADGLWPDGSRKGFFQCSISGIPGAKPQDAVLPQQP